MGSKNKKALSVSGRPSDAGIPQAFQDGDMNTKISFFLFGFGNLVNRQIARGLIFLALEIGYFVYLFTFGIRALGDFITLGTREKYLMKH